MPTDRGGPPRAGPARVRADRAGARAPPPRPPRPRASRSPPRRSWSSALAALIATRAGDGLTKLEHRSAPQFTLLYPAGDVHRVKAGPGEIVRLRSGRGRLRHGRDDPAASRSRPTRGSVSGLLPVFADRQAAALARELPGFRFRTDGKARVNDAPGYQLRYRAGPPNRRTLGTDVLVVPEDGDRDGVLLRFRQTNPPRALDEADKELVKATRKAFRSFRFG